MPYQNITTFYRFAFKLLDRKVKFYDVTPVGNFRFNISMFYMYQVLLRWGWYGMRNACVYCR